MQPGDRYTWDGDSLENYVPVELQAELEQLAARLNAMPAENRAACRRDAKMVQTFREGGYVFDADNCAVPVGSK
jgi:hypothetical protein